MNQDKTIISLFDYSGSWSKPYRENGYNVIQQDLKLGQCIVDDTVPNAIKDYVDGNKVYGILSAVPCTDFAGSGARWWNEKETMPANYAGDNVKFKNTIELSMFFVFATQLLVELFNPVFWCIENPVGRIHKLVPEIGKPKLYFNPCDFGDPYTKKTALYGNFNTNLKMNPVFPSEGSKMWRLYGGKSERTKELRSKTPEGFAKVFFEANK